MLEAKIKLSIVLPTRNERMNPYVSEILKRVSLLPNTEVICVDGGSGDTLARLSRQLGVTYLRLPGSNRAQRLNCGIRSASGRMILLHHPRSMIERKGFDVLLERSDDPFLWGGFIQAFDMDHPFLRFTSWYSNKVRFLRKGIVYLDHCIFASAELLAACGGVPDLDIFEDTELSLRLRRYSQPAMIASRSTTSAVRFNKNGFLRQGLLNQVLKTGYWLGLPHRWMNAVYERKVSLNSDYSRDEP